jgi:sterol desaturase/sphingolipid hydroxylase (fatty acid hydroxylase superfamily)
VPCTAALTALITARLGSLVIHEGQALFGARQSMLETYGANVALQTVALMYAYSFFDYWLHVADHKVPLFWALHRAHHSAESLTFFTAQRANPLEHLQVALVAGIGMGLAGGVVCYATGSSLLKASLVVTAGIKLVELALYTSLAHTHIPVSFGRFNALYSGPIMHQLHHSAELRHRDRNLGSGVGIIWDVIFGTYYAPKPGEQFRIGANEDDIGANNPHLTLRQLYTEPCRRMWRLIVERKAFSRME